MESTVKKKSEVAEIANPTYDVVFKYMMDDIEIAKLIISTIIGEDVISLEPLPQEQPTEKMNPVDNDTSITVYRLDFTAKIKVVEGIKLVMIEMQKASLPTDIPRFRNYLGERYSKPEEVKITDGKIDRTAIGAQIYCLYFLGNDIGYKKVPVLKVSPQVSDAATRKRFLSKNKFIEGLHHRSWIIQINFLKGRRRNEAEKLLAVFDQSYCTSDQHIMSIREEDYPEKYHPIIRRLKMAATDSKVRKQMKKEDTEISYIRRMIRDENEKAVEKTIKEYNEKLEKKEVELEKKEVELAAEKKARAEDKKIITQLKQLIKNAGITDVT